MKPVRYAIGNFRLQIVEGNSCPRIFEDQSDLRLQIGGRHVLRQGDAHPVSTNALRNDEHASLSAINAGDGRCPVGPKTVDGGEEAATGTSSMPPTTQVGPAKKRIDRRYLARAIWPQYSRCCHSGVLRGISDALFIRSFGVTGCHRASACICWRAGVSKDGERMRRRICS
jgi:hypothetical protein